MPENSYYIVMTHNHQMDFDISQAILTRGDFSYLGLIASDTKWRRFQQRYKHRGIDQQQVTRMNCPIGLAQVGGKLPIEVAVSVAAEIISIYQAEQKLQAKQNTQASTELGNSPNSKFRPTSQQGIYWKEFTQLLTID